jgi:hypothetical protein
MDTLGDGLRHDPAARRKSVRRGRERGCWVYIPKIDLQATGIDPDEAPPEYKTWAGDDGGVRVRLYRSG